MGHIAEPKNIDFIIESPPLSDEERNEISEFIEKLKSKKSTTKPTKGKKKEKSLSNNKS
jgi:hypothetical protein